MRPETGETTVDLMLITFKEECKRVSMVRGHIDLNVIHDFLAYVGGSSLPDPEDLFHHAIDFIREKNLVASDIEVEGIAEVDFIEELAYQLAFAANGINMEYDRRDSLSVKSR